MEEFVKGDVIVINFPFSNLVQFKPRPALIIKVPKGEDIIICQITSESQNKDVEILLKNNEFVSGGLKQDSYIRVDKITTIKRARIKYKIGSLKPEKFKDILDKICSFLKD